MGKRRSVLNDKVFTMSLPLLGAGPGAPSGGSPPPPPPGPPANAIYYGGTVEPIITSGWNVFGSGAGGVVLSGTNHEVLVVSSPASVTSIAVGTAGSAGANGSVGAGSAFTGLAYFGAIGQPVIEVFGLGVSNGQSIDLFDLNFITSIPTIPNNTQNVHIRRCALITSLPNIPTTCNSFECSSCALTTVPTIPTLVKNLFLNDNLLPQSAVDAVLANCVANGQGLGVLYLNGTGNSAPSAAGVANAATLTGIGWTVFINP